MTLKALDKGVVGVLADNLGEVNLVRLRVQEDAHREYEEFQLWIGPQGQCAPLSTSEHVDGFELVRGCGAVGPGISK